MVVHRKYPHSSAHTVYVDDHRTLTILADSSITLAKWLKDALKSPPNTTVASNSRSRTILVGLSAEREEDGPRDSCYDLLSLSIGSYSLIYFLPLLDEDRLAQRLLNSFFYDSRIVVVGTDVAAVREILRTHHGVEIGKAIFDVKGFVENRLRNRRSDIDIDIRRCDLHHLAGMVLERHMELMRTAEEKVKWWNAECLTHEKIKQSTIDVYICYSIGSKFMGTILHGAKIVVASTTTANKVDSKNKKKNKNQGMKKTFKPNYYVKHFPLSLK